MKIPRRFIFLRGESIHFFKKTFLCIKLQSHRLHGTFKLDKPRLGSVNDWLAQCVLSWILTEGVFFTSAVAKSVVGLYPKREAMPSNYRQLAVAATADDPNHRVPTEAELGDVVYYERLTHEVWPPEHLHYARCISTKTAEAARFNDYVR